MRECFFCGTSIDEKLPVFRSTVCPQCGKDLKICVNCRFYKKGAHMDCMESIAEPVRDKDRSNFCSYFQFLQRKSENRDESREKAAKDDFNRLFGDS